MSRNARAIVLKIIYRPPMVLFIFYLVNSCIEPFEIEIGSFENILVVEATLTNEIKQHQITLSRTFGSDEDGFAPENNATVKITDDMGNEYSFGEIEPGKYISVSTFKAQQGRSYQLSVITKDGRSFASETVETPKNVDIDKLYVNKDSNQNGEEGVSIFVDTFDSANDKGYFRYEYEETYRIIAPFWNPFDFDIIDDIWDRDGFEVGIKLKEQEERVCYNTVASKDIIQTSTLRLAENQIFRYLVRFINRNNYIISHRYSILVHQYTQTRDAYEYYQSLKDFSSSESIFSEIQPGFLGGNVFTRNDADEKVLGYFEVAPLSSRRIFFTYAKLFPDEPLPPYAINCEPTGSPPLVEPTADGASSPLIQAIRNGLIKYHATNENNFVYPYLTKARPCGDCTVLGSNIVPEFWVD